MTELDWSADLKAVFPGWQTDAAAEHWLLIRDSLFVGQVFTGTVISRAPFGVWLDIGVGQPALLLVTDMADARVKKIRFDDYPQKGEELQLQVKALGDRGEIAFAELKPDSAIEHEIRQD